LYFIIKAFLGYLAVILMRAALPRIRIDHMLDLNWKFLVPVALAVVVFTIVTDKAFQLYAPTDSPWARAGVLFLANVLLGWLVYYAISGTARRLRREEEAALDGHDAGHGAGPGGHDGHEPAHETAGDAHAAPAPAH
jgi:hypothetical protein